MTVKNSNSSFFRSNDDELILINGMWIMNDRNKPDYVWLDRSDLYGILVGTDGYPKKDEELIWYYIGGGDNWNFKATVIEFYGVNTQT